MVRDVRVLDLSHNIAGAYCARLFGAVGADVIKVEPTGGDPLRAVPPLLTTPTAGETPRSAAFEYLNAHKRGLALDTGSEAGAAALDRLIAGVQLVISSEHAAPETALAFERRVREVNPRAVHVVSSAYGLSGPYRAYRDGDLTDWASGGYLYITGDPAREPLQGGGPWCGYIGGVTAAVGAMAALHHAKLNGRGQMVDVSTMEAVAAAHQWSFVLWTHQGVVKQRAANRHAESYHPIALEPVKDGWVCIAVATPAQWQNFCIAIDKPELIEDPRYASGGARFDRADELDEIFAPWLTARTRTEVVDELQAHHVPASAVLALDEVLEDEQLQIRAFWQEAPDLGPGAKMPGAPFRLGDEVPFRPAPRLGQHSSEVLAEAGLSEDKVAALAREGAVVVAGEGAHA